MLSKKDWQFVYTAFMNQNPKKGKEVFKKLLKTAIDKKSILRPALTQ